jgi:uncharacterized protein
MRAVNRTRNKTLVETGNVAATAWSRMRGLLGHAPLGSGEGLLLSGEKAIHTVGMGFAIDVLFLDRECRVVHLLRTMTPWRFSKFVWRACNVLELPPGKIEETGTCLADQIEIQFD